MEKPLGWGWEFRQKSSMIHQIDPTICPFASSRKTTLAASSFPAVWHDSHEGRLEAMVDIAVAAGRHTLGYFRRQELIVDLKADESPVTVADREAEQEARKRIASRYPADAVAGEEFADVRGTSDYRWTIDPIDGTKSFVCGVPLYSTLLALEYQDEPVGGAIILPALREAVVAAVGGGCYYSDDLEQWRATRVSDRKELSAAVFVTSEVQSFVDRGDPSAFERMQSSCWLTRTWGDGYGYMMVATGRADVMVDPICKAWDVAAILPILSEAGGRFTDWAGRSTVRGGDGVGTNGRLHDAALAVLAGKASTPAQDDAHPTRAS